MKRMKEAWDDIYENSIMSTQTLRDNAARFRKHNSFPSLMEVRYRNDVEPEAIHKESSNQLEVKKTLRRMKTMRKKSWKISTIREMEKVEL